MHDADEVRWRAAVRPDDWAEPPVAAGYGLVVLGGGPAGLVAALGAAGLGVRVALVERAALGGDCLNAGCVPSKAFLAAAPSGVAAALATARRKRADLSVHDAAERLRAAGVDVFFGDARFDCEDHVGVGQHRLRFARCVIATGSRARRTAWMAACPERILTHEGFFALREAPSRVVVVGGGVVGCELAQGLATAGVPTTLLVRGAVLEREARDATDVVVAGLRASGVVVRQGEVRSARPVVDGVTLTVSEGAELHASHVLVAIGRTIDLDALDLDRAGVATAEGRLVLDPYLRTTNPSVFAAGDVVGLPPSTHAADAMARIVLRNALAAPTQRLDPSLLARTVLTSPPLAVVGAQQAEPGRTAVQVAFEALDGPRCADRAEGFVRVWVDGRGRIHGATVVGEGAPEVLAALCVAIQARTPLSRLSDLVLPYPTRGEVLRKLGDAWRRQRFSAGWSRWARLWLRLRLGRWAVRR